MQYKDKVFSGIYPTSLDAVNALNFKLLDWNMTDKKQRFGQYLESGFSKLCLPPYYYESNDSFEVFNYMCDLIEEEYNNED